jgi:hypothetical protein
MANRRSSDSRRTSAPSSSVSGPEAARGAGTASTSGSAQTAPSPARSPRRRAAAAEPAVPAPRGSVTVSAETRRAMIAEAAYLRAERRGFTSGREEEDWLAAEKEVDALLSAGQGGPQ